ncbi:hypothetical protein [Cohnella hongkongensis]|uniref:Uncharacterized protein n=1 Tax=Cohnella hongkongensis TaxID=178337 RepID=A0ABV9FB35_9BACL
MSISTASVMCLSLCPQRITAQGLLPYFLMLAISQQMDEIVKMLQP